MPPCSVPECGRPILTRKSGLCRAHYLRQWKHGELKADVPVKGETTRWIEAHKNYDSDECLTWPFSRTRNGYGRINVEGKAYLASRYMCIAAHGEPSSESLLAIHSCGKGHEACVNPRHLSWGTHSQNMMDKVRDGTDNRGVKSVTNILAESDVLAIVDLDKAGASAPEIARKFGIATTTVHSIRYGLTWSWLTGIAPKYVSNDNKNNKAAA